ncbi:MAG: lysophospholipid acyltransferase family protein [Anaerolineales bacterium]|nr:lysophospholipid acyltransferase family protein [Anaerolineales bacterium]
MDVNTIAKSSLGPIAAFTLARILPRSFAFWMADRITAHLSRNQSSEMVQAIRSNQAVVQSLEEGDPVLDKAVWNVLRHAGRCQVDLYKAIGAGPRALLRSCKMENSLAEGLDYCRESKRGLVVVGAHMSNFDMFLLSIHSRGIKAQVLSYPNPQGSYRVQNRIRKKFGVDLAPTSMKSLRTAFRTLSSGGIVATGVDRPGLGGEPLKFFGRQVVLPVGHARLAVRTGSPILAGVVQSNGWGKYQAIGSPLFEPESSGDEHQDTLDLAQRVLQWFEDCIRERPEEWLMFYPVWEETG